MARPADPQRREDILRAAKKVFLERGYSDTRLTDIAQEANIVPSTLYLYFDSKEAMVHALSVSVRQQIVQNIRPILERLQGEEDVRQLVQTLLAPVDTNPDMFRLVQLDDGLISVRLHPSRLAHGPIFVELTEILKARMEFGYIRQYDPVILMDTLAGFFRWMIDIYSLLNADEKTCYQKTFIQMLCHMLFP